MSRRSHARFFEALSDAKSEVEQKVEVNDQSTAAAKSSSPTIDSVSAQEYYQVAKKELAKDLRPYDLAMAVEAMALSARLFKESGQFKEAAQVWMDLQGYMLRQVKSSMSQYVASRDASPRAPSALPPRSPARKPASESVEKSVMKFGM